MKHFAGDRVSYLLCEGFSRSRPYCVNNFVCDVVLARLCEVLCWSCFCCVKDSVGDARGHATPDPRPPSSVGGGGDDGASVATSGGPAARLVIWGTDVVVSTCKDKFRRFLSMFIDPETEEDERVEDMNEAEPLYLQKLEEVSSTSTSILPVTRGGKLH